MSDASKTGKRGGARPGAGRKPKPRAEAPIPPIIALDPFELARERAKAALGALLEVVMRGKSDVARVRAANLVLDRAIGKPTGDGSHLFKIVEFDTSDSSGDPATFRAEARKHVDAIFAVLSWISLHSKNEGARIAASASLIERAHGAAQTPQTEAPPRAPAAPGGDGSRESWEALLAKGH